MPLLVYGIVSLGLLLTGTNAAAIQPKDQPLVSHGVEKLFQGKLNQMTNINGADRTSRECRACEFLIEILHALWGTHGFDNCIVEAIVYICVHLNIEDNFVCARIVGPFRVNLMQDEVLYVIKQLVIEPKQLCNLLISDCGIPFLDPNKAKWILPMPGTKPPFAPVHQPAPGSSTKKMLHISDTHVDMDYAVGTEAHCNEPQCCRHKNDTGDKSTKTIQQPAGYWGTIADCDVPYWTITNMLQHIQQTHTDIDYILLTGDYEAHADWNYSKNRHEAIIRNLTQTMKNMFPHLPIYFCLGNHEGVPVDSMPPHSVPVKYWPTWLYDTIADAWGQWIPADQQTTIRFRGSYMTPISPGLRLISLNTMFGDSYNFWLQLNETDPDGTMSWFIEQLYAAEQVGDKVYVIGHISVGIEGWAINYVNAINRFENTVVGQFFGHSHKEEFHIVYEDANDPTSRASGVVQIAGSVTTYSSQNPAYRIYTLDGDYHGSTYQILDIDTYFLNLTEANANPQHPVWRHLTSAKRDYEMSSMLPKDWSELINRMDTNRTLFDRFVLNYYRRDDVSCDNSCRKRMLCDFRKMHNNNTLCAGLQKESEPMIEQGSDQFDFSHITLESVKEEMKKMKLTAQNDLCPI